MRSKLLLFILLCNVCLLKAQYVTIPNANFVTWLQTHYPSCMVGNQMDTTCSAIVNETGIIIAGAGTVSDLSGVEYFDNLDSLTCTNSFVAVIPRLPGSLEYFSCNNNSLTSLP